MVAPGRLTRIGPKTPGAVADDRPRAASSVAVIAERQPRALQLRRARFVGDLELRREVVRIFRDATRRRKT